MILHTWGATFTVNGKLERLGGTDPMHLSGKPTGHDFDTIKAFAFEKADKAFGKGQWSAAKIFDRHAWHARPASDYGWTR
jgi:hypothetical protein